MRRPFAVPNGVRLGSVLVFAFALCAGLGLASCNGHEHPEHPEKAAVAGQDPDIETVAKFLERHVAETSTDGRYAFQAEDGRKLSLKLDRVHRERLSKVAPHRYFVCADLAGADGTVYDLDFWVQSSDQGLTVTETTLHKVSGKEIYTWSLKDGVWVRKFADGRSAPAQPASGKPAGPATGSNEEEHPEEHPEEKKPAAEEEHPEHPEETR